MDNQTVMIFKKRYLHIVCFSMAICTLFFTKVLLAKQYQLQLIVDLSEFNGVSTDGLWLEPLTIPTSGGKFFVAQDNGLIYLVDKETENTHKPIINLPLDVNDPSFIFLTSMALHPSFSEPEQAGYATLFTSHTTQFDHKKNNNQLKLDDDNADFDFETVITAWEYDFDRQTIDPQTQREVLRIPIKTLDGAIQNLTFDPYQKPWNTDYGQLYFSLKYSEELASHPLYSGVVLGIYPLMFGARNYTVPPTNPFIKEPEINDEIVVVGGQNIEHFFWSKYDQGSIFIQHNNSEQHWLSKAKLGENLLTQSPSNILWQQPSAMSPMLLYQGRHFLNLRNKMVFFSLLDNHWHLTSSALEPLNNESPKVEKLITEDVLSPTSHLSIHKYNQGEIVLIDNQKSRMYLLQSIKSTSEEVITPQLNITSTESNDYIAYISLLVAGIVLSIFIYRKKMKHNRSIVLLDKDHLLFKYEVATKSILLFKPNQKNVFKTLPINNVFYFEVLLNNLVINIIDNQSESAFSNEKEAQMRDLFIKEHNEKMLDKSTRHINIVLSDKEGRYNVCLYLRKGSVRVTGSKYYTVIDILVDLCWNISKRIHPQTTEKRFIPLVAFSRPNMTIPARQDIDPQPSSHGNINHSTNDPIGSKVTSEKSTDHSTPQTEMVDALDKLVHLHQQGHLSDEEFSLAKTKLLQS